MPDSAVMVSLRRRHRNTLAAIFVQPTRANIRWANIEPLLLACGAVIQERAGSRIFVVLNGAGSHFHRPHPERVAGKGLVEQVRAFLIEAGIEP